MGQGSERRESKAIDGQGAGCWTGPGRSLLKKAMGSGGFSQNVMR